MTLCRLCRRETEPSAALWYWLDDDADAGDDADGGGGGDLGTNDVSADSAAFETQESMKTKVQNNNDNY